MNSKSFNVRNMTIMALLIAILLLMMYTPIGYLQIGPLAITMNMIPVAIAAISLGPKGGAAIGAVFGLTSFLKCLGIAGGDAFGAALLGINPIYTFIVCVITRLLAGLAVGLIYEALRHKAPVSLNISLAGFLAAALNTILFMTTLALLFGNTDIVRGMTKEGLGLLPSLFLLVAVNAIAEIVISTLVVGAVGFAMYKAKLIGNR